MHKVAQYVIKPTHPAYGELDGLAYAARKLRNSLLYDMRQAFFDKNAKMPRESELRKQRGRDNCPLWRALPAKLSREVSRRLGADWKGYWGKRKNDPTARIPGYARGNARGVVEWATDAINTPRDGKLRLTGVAESLVPLPVPQARVKQVRLVPRQRNYVLEVVYVVKPHPTPRTTGVIAGLDFGVTNFATVACDNADTRPLIVCGRYPKSVNQWANKHTSALRKQLPKRQGHAWKQVRGSKRIQAVWEKRNRQIKAWTHWATRQIVTYCLANNVRELVVGWNPGWKSRDTTTGGTMGKRGNQNFRTLPMRAFLDTLTYKLAEHGITVAETEESYTSKTSVLHGEQPHKQTEYAAKRVKRGLLVGPVGALNADVNAAAQIARKCNPNAFTWAEGLAGTEGLHQPQRVACGRRLPRETGTTQEGARREQQNAAHVSQTPVVAQCYN